MNTLTIARFTLHEAVSRRLVLAGLLLSLAFVGLFALGFGLLYSEVARESGSGVNSRMLGVFGTLMTVLGLYAVYFLSSFLALFLSVGAISGEIDAGTLHALLARPLRRFEFILGRWLAYVFLISTYIGLMAGLLLLIARLISGYQPPSPAQAVGLMMLGAVLLVSLSLLGSVVLSTLANGVVVFTLFGLAWLAGIIEFIGAVLSNEAMLNVGIAISLLVPTDALWRGASYFVQSPTFLAMAGGPPTAPFIGSAPPTTALLVWAILYVSVALALAMRMFGRRDL